MNLEIPIVQQRLSKRKADESSSPSDSDSLDGRHDRVERSKLKQTKKFVGVFESVKAVFYISTKAKTNKHELARLTISLQHSIS